MDEAMISQVRRFNRIVTQRVGALNDRFLARDRSLGEARLLWDIGADGRDARSLRTQLELDSGYMSRMLRSLEAAGLVTVGPRESDKRVRVARLTPAGAAERAALDQRSDELAASLLAPLGARQRDRLVARDGRRRAVSGGTLCWAAVTGSIDMPAQRLRNQRLVGPPFVRAEEAVRWLGAVQAQDYGGAKWGIAQRTGGLTDADLDRSFAAGTVLRTHVMRPTWHLVLPDDIRWLLTLTAPRVHAANAYYYRRLELDDAVFARSNAAIAKALRGGVQLTRTELARVLGSAGIGASGLRLAYLMMRAELDAVITSGARRGRQFTYALLDERAPHSRTLERDEALAELTKRYFESHGPALVRDFSNWSGLTAADARAGIEMNGTGLAQTTLDGGTYWFAPSAVTAQAAAPTLHLLPNYDEYLIAYEDYSPVFDASLLRDTTSPEAVLAGHILVVDGRVMGGWRRTVERAAVTIAVEPLVRLDDAQRHALQAAAERYGLFLGMPVAVAVRE
jgi:DNA-binding MarR family transcriptional regulator